MVTSPRRRVRVAGAVALLLVGAVACSDPDDSADDSADGSAGGSAGGGEWDPDAPFAPSLRPAFGARVDGERLTFSTGTPCHDVTRIRIVFDPYTAGSTDTILTATEPGRTVETFDPTGVVTGFTVEEGLPSGFDWRESDTATFELKGSDFEWGSTVDLDEPVAASPDHPTDVFFFQGVGWLDPAAVAAGNGDTFLTPCTADPAAD
ncbi:hypothetical protein [Nocardioides sp.]|uniref:hypothetical protein n=1 Tax=Nocardioides sp. TaxID=35761 RepID=UPI002715855E|nr:hypothetical protein [Nocardioides sp.]MDO9454497.1 hypothetical protein [Nocardioides sp.]